MGLRASQVRSWPKLVILGPDDVVKCPGSGLRPLKEWMYIYCTTIIPRVLAMFLVYEVILSSTVSLPSSAKTPQLGNLKSYFECLYD